VTAPKPQPPVLEDDKYIGGRAVRGRYSASAMWLHRRLHDDSGFPQPDLVIAGRNYWKISTLEAWERRTAGGKA
jgi:hypothetical protein